MKTFLCFRPHASNEPLLNKWLSCNAFTKKINWNTYLYARERRPSSLGWCQKELMKQETRGDLWEWSNLFPRFNISVKAPFFFFRLSFWHWKWHLCLISAFTLNIFFGDGSHFVETWFPSQGETYLLKVCKRGKKKVSVNEMWIRCVLIKWLKHINYCSFAGRWW